MRIRYLTILSQKIRQGGFVWCLKYAFKYLAIKIFYLTNINLSGPVIGMLFVTFRCNFECIMCSCKRRYRENVEELKTDEMLRIIDSFAHIGTSAITFTGGEPLLRRDIFILINHAKKCGLFVNFCTNGFLLDDKKIDALLAAGVDGINLPLDGVTADTHDRIRGVKGSYEKVIYAIKRIGYLRKKSKKKFSLNISCVIHKYNIDEILDLVLFVSELGVDNISFTPIQAQDNIDISLLMPDFNKAQAVITKLIELKKKKKLIDCSFKYLKLLNSYFANKENTISCFAGYSSCTVDCYGNIYPCILGGPIVSNIKDIPLEECWRSNKFNKVREKIKTCNRCYWNCWKELSLIFNGPII